MIYLSILIFVTFVNAYSTNNLLLKKPIESTFAISRKTYLNDGDKDNNIWSYSHKFDYAVIDMQSIYKVSNITIYSRYYWTKQKYSIYLADIYKPCFIDEFIMSLKECVLDVAGDQPIKEFQCINGGVTGRYFVIMIGKYKNENPDYGVDLKEVEAYGEFIKEVKDEKIEFNDTETFEAMTYKNYPIATAIFNDNEKIEIPKYSSNIQSTMSNCEPIIWNKQNSRIFAKACTGLTCTKSRLAIFAKDWYYWNLNRQPQYASFLKSLNKWLCGSENPNILNIEEYKNINELKNKLKRHNIVIIRPFRTEINQELLNDFFDYANSRKIGIIVQDHLWGSITENYIKNMARIWKDYAVNIQYGFTTWSSDLEVNLSYNDLNDNFGSLENLIDRSVRSHKYLLANIETIIKNLNDVSKEILPIQQFRYMFLEFLEKYQKFLEINQPCANNLISGDDRKLFEFLGELGLSDALIDSNYTLPGVHSFPGIFNSNIVTSKHIIKVKGLAKSTANPIGLYLKPGDTLKYSVIESKGQWWFRVGCHTDRIPYTRDTWSRYPKISKDVSLDKEGKVFSSYGGVLFLYNSDVDDFIKIEISNVVRSPFFNLRDNDAAKKWDDTEKNQPGLWSQIAGDNMVFCEESKLIRKFDGAYLTNLMGNVWDKIVKMDFAIKGEEWIKDRGEMTVLDEQISIGWGHSGYPIEVHRPWHINMFDYKTISTEGTWGMCHEIGHNMQLGVWTFSGTGEVTNNLFCLYNYDKLLKLPYYGSNETNLSDGAKTYLLNPIFSQWTSSPFTALMTYSHLVNHMGWGFIHKTFLYYKNNAINPSNDDDKIKQWMNITSIVSGQNLLPIYEYWGFKMDVKLSEELAAKFSCFTPNDFITNIAKERFEEIKSKYKNCHTISKFNEDFDYEGYIKGRRPNNFEIM